MDPSNNGLGTPQEQASIDYDGTPSFTPRKIRASKVLGTSGKPAAIPADIPPNPPTTDVATSLEDFTTLQTKFDRVAVLLDKRGQTMTICQNLPESIRERYLRQKRSDESCWAFYKRMVDLALEFPDVDPNNLTTYAEQLATHGNDIVLDPFSSSTIPDPYNGNSGTYNGLSGEQRTKDFNENPGKDTLLLMLFLAILRLILSAIFNFAFPPIKGLLDKINNLFGTKLDGPSAKGLGAGTDLIGSIVKGAANLVEIAVNALGEATQAIGAIGTTIFFEVVKNAALDLVEKIISGGPKLSRDVERYDALIISSHVKEVSRYSNEQNWPEAALLYPQFKALGRQFDAGKSIFAYFTQNSLAVSRESSNAPGGVASNKPQIPTDLNGVLSIQKDFIGSALDRMSALLAGSLVDTLFCCLFRFLGSQDLRWLQTVKAILGLALNRHALTYESLDSALANLWHTIEKVVLSKILSILYNLFDEINTRIKGSLGLQAQTSLFKSEICPPWNLFIGNMLQFIGGIEQSILDLVVDLHRSLQSQDEYGTIYIDTLANSQYIRQLLRLIDIIIAAKQFGNLCKDSSVPSDEELRSLFEETKDQFNIGSDSPAGSNNLAVSNSTSLPSIEGLRNQFDECLSKVPQEKVEEVRAWIEHLTGSQNA